MSNLPPELENDHQNYYPWEAFSPKWNMKTEELSFGGGERWWVPVEDRILQDPYLGAQVVQMFEKRKSKREPWKKIS